MAAITATSTRVNGDFVVTETALGASDTLTYSSGGRQLLILRNPTGASVAVTIDGSAGTTISPSGYGGTVSVASGKTINVAAGATRCVNLDTISAFCQGTVAVTGGTGVYASILTF
jgi:hypothetical protein